MTDDNESFVTTRLGRIPRQWKVVELRDIALKIQDGNYGGDYPKADEFIEAGVPFLTSKALVGTTIAFDKIDYISPEKHALLRKAQIEHGDILLTNRGAKVGCVALTPEVLHGGNIGPQVTLIRGNSGKVDIRFLFQFLNSEFFRKQLNEFDNGSAMNFLS